MLSPHTPHDVSNTCITTVAAGVPADRRKEKAKAASAVHVAGAERLRPEGDRRQKATRPPARSFCIFDRIEVGLLDGPKATGGGTLRSSAPPRLLTRLNRKKSIVEIGTVVPSPSTSPRTVALEQHPSKGFSHVLGQALKISRDAASIGKLQFERAKTLYGRDAELSKLMEAFGRVSSFRNVAVDESGSGVTAGGEAGNAEVILISGRSGTGKSAIYKGMSDELRRKRQASRAVKKKSAAKNMAGRGSDRAPPPLTVFLAEGKFDKLRQAEPYSAVALAFSQLCDEILSLRNAEEGATELSARDHDLRLFHRLRDSIRGAVGSEVEVLADVVPNLRSLLEEGGGNPGDAAAVAPHPRQPRPANIRASFNGQHALNAMKFGLQRFARAVSSPAHPVIVNLDDLQWADTASLELVETLVTDRELSGFLFVGCYRNDEVQTELNNSSVEVDAPTKTIERHLSGSSRSSSRRLIEGQLSGASRSSSKRLIEERQLSGASRSSSRRLGSDETGAYGKSPTPTNALEKGPSVDTSADTDAQHPLAKALQRIERHHRGTTAITRVVVENLPLDAVNDLLTDVLCLDADQTSDLAEIVIARTHGNAFFVREFLTSLHADGMLRYCTTSLRYRWELGKIKACTSAANNVVDIMRDKLNTKLPPGAKELVQVAACLGYSFEEHVISLIVSSLSGGDIDDLLENDCKEEKHPQNNDEDNTSAQMKRDIADSLRICCEEGLLEIVASASSSGGGGGARKSTTTYRFVHDRVQEAAYSLVPDNLQKTLSLRIGQVLVSELAEEDLEKLLFLAVDHCNDGAELIPPGNEYQTSLMTLNFRAGKKAMESAAFSAASTYLEMAISLLPPDHWGAQFDFCVDLYSTAAEAELSSGKFLEMRSHVDAVLASKGCDVLGKVRAYSTLMDYFFANDLAHEAMNVSLELLAQLGIRFPSFGLKLAIVKDLFKTKSMLKSHEVSSLVDLPLMEDEKKLAAMQAMDKLLTFAYLINPDLLPIVSFKMIRYSLKDGISKYTPGALVVFALIHIGVLGEFQKAKEYGELAISILERLGDKKYEPRVRFLETNFIRHWTKPAQKMYDLYKDTLEMGMRTGDVQHGMLSAAMICHVALNIGKPLSLVESHCRRYCQQMADHGQELTRNLTLPLWQFALNMMGRSDNPVSLTGDAMDQTQLLARAKESKDPHLYDHILNHQMWLACFFRDYDLAWKLVRETKDLDKSRMAAYDLNRASLFKGVTLFAMARKTNKASFKRLARRHMALVKKWIELGNVNCLYFLRLFEAEDAALRGKMDDAKDIYFDALTISARFGFPNDRALIAERAGCFFAEVQEDAHWASHYMNLADKTYRDWGAVAKCNQLRSLHPDLGRWATNQG